MFLNNAILFKYAPHQHFIALISSYRTIEVGRYYPSFDESIIIFNSIITPVKFSTTTRYSQIKSVILITYN